MDQGWVVFVAIVGALGWALGYLVACLGWPFTSCGKCSGVGRFRSPSGRAWRKCKRCRGSGEQVRAGRRVWTWLTKVKKAAID